MIRMAILGSAAALAMSLPAAAQQYGYDGYDYDDGYGYDSYGYQDQAYANANANCDRDRRSNQTAGTVVGAIAGGLLGAAIADDGDKHHRKRHHRYSRGWDRGYGYGYRGHRRHRDNDGDKVAGALIGGVVGAMAGNALAGSMSNCNTTRAYGPDTRQRYGNMNVSPPTRQPYGNAWNENRPRSASYGNSYQGDVDLRPGEELYGGSPQSNPAWSNPEYGATTQGYNAGYSAPQDTGECRTVYRDRYVNGQRVSEPATACNVGGDRWEFVD
ncbi:glycine zipper 2TM domain-containing protein [Henriciella aquimarina]|uniref:glycine zipper 2TM domain-containing protein n=1 Tax=Henriciella aquimarina TaxID=545261 RepID=UPI000A004E97|nr:glycine zipper 2TM domain-containing protein [Henriciella aquimarina]